MRKSMQKGMKKLTLLMTTIVLLVTTGCAPFFHGGRHGGHNVPKFAEQQSYLYEGKNEDVHQVINEMISQHKVNQEKETQLVTSLN